MSQMDACVTVVKIAYTVLSLYHGLDVRATVVGIGANFNDSRLSTVVQLRTEIGAWAWASLNRLHRCEKSGLLMVSSNGVVLAIPRAVSIAGCAWYKSGGQAIFWGHSPGVPHLQILFKAEPYFRLLSETRVCRPKRNKPWCSQQLNCLFQ